MFSEVDGSLSDYNSGLLDSSRQKINHSLVRRLPLQQKDRISAVLNCSRARAYVIQMSGRRFWYLFLHFSAGVFKAQVKLCRSLKMGI